jgi:hypothetical protein
LDVFIALTADLNKLLQHIGVSQHAKAVIVLAELKQNSVSVQGLLEIVFVIGRQSIKKSHNYLVTFLSENFLHFLLLSRKHLSLIFGIVVVIFSIRTV